MEKIGRSRPVLYRGRFNVPHPVIKRLAASKNHFNLARTANFNVKVDQYYLTIDNILFAIILAKEGNLTTNDHRRKIVKFFNHLKRRAKIRSIDENDFHEFYELWSKSRYSLFFPKSSKNEKIRLFFMHLIDFAITEIARSLKSDETILSQKVEELLEIYESESIQNELEEAERLGDRYGGKMGMKLANPWNFIDVSLLTDRNDIREFLDDSEDIQELFVDLIKNWDKIILKIQLENFKRIALEIADAKMKKRGIEQDVAMTEAIEAAAKHPMVQRFRLTLNATYDSTGPKRTAFVKMMKAAKD